MVIDMASVKELFSFIHQKFTVENNKERKKAYKAHKELTHELIQNLYEQITENQKEESYTTKVKITKMSPQDQSNCERDLQLILKLINKSVYDICYYQALLTCSARLLEKGHLACQEHSTLVSLALIKQLGVNNGPRVECIQLATDKGNHELVVYNRIGRIEDVASWGRNCLIIDSHQNYIATIDKLPVNSALASLKQDKAASGVNIQVEFDSKMGLNLLVNFSEKPKHVYHNMEKNIRNYLIQYYQQVIDTACLKTGLPPLRALPEIQEDNPNNFFSGRLESSSNSNIGSSDDLISIEESAHP